MEQRASRTRFIHNRRDALVALSLAGLFMAISVRDVIVHPQRKFQWPILLGKPLDFGLPTSAVTAVNLAFYAYLLFGVILFYRQARGTERVLVAGWVSGLFFGPIRNLISVQATAAISYMELIGNVVALVAALYIYLSIPASDTDPRVA
jgi:hypothetical protein